MLCALFLLLPLPLRQEEASQQPSPPPPQEASLQTPQEAAAEALVELVDLADPALRRKAASELAKRKHIELQHWLQAASAFGAFEATAPGYGSAQVDLWVGDGIEATHLHWYVPTSYKPLRASGVIVAAHGAGGDGSSMVRLWREVAESLGLLVLAPTEAGANAGYAFSERERLSLLAALRWFRRNFNVDENRIHLTGISRGGHLCWDLASRHPGVWASVVPMIGGPAFLPGERNNLRLVENLAHLPLRQLQGMRDDPRLIRNLRVAFDKLALASAANARMIEFAELGHDFRLQEVDWAAFFGEARRQPLGKSFQVRSARKGEGAAYWVAIDRLSSAVKEEHRPRVDAKEWNALDEEGQMRLWQAGLDQHTAMVDAHFLQEGQIELRQRGVKRLRILLPQSMLGEKNQMEALLVDLEKRADLRAKGRDISKAEKRSRKKLAPKSAVLLSYFAEHFDRSFLPVAEWVLK